MYVFHLNGDVEGCLVSLEHLDDNIFFRTGGQVKEATDFGVGGRKTWQI